MEIIRGNIFNTNHQTIVNTVNCYGVMGAGLAQECKLRYPEMYKRYKVLCKRKQLKVGMLYLYKADSKWILNFPTKNHWKYKSKPEYLVEGLKKFVSTYQEKGVESVAFPLLGAKNGGIPKSLSFEILDKYLNNLEIPVEVYDYDSEEPDDLIHSFSEIINSNTNADLSEMIGIRNTKVSKIKAAILDNKLTSIIQLLNIDGLGEDTISKCYAFMMKNNGVSVQLKLFGNG